MGIKVPKELREVQVILEPKEHKETRELTATKEPKE